MLTTEVRRGGRRRQGATAVHCHEEPRRNGDREFRALSELHRSDKAVSLPRQRLDETRRARNVAETLA